MKLQDPRVASLKTLQKDCVQRFELLNMLEVLELLELLVIEVLVMLVIEVLVMLDD